MRFWLATVWLRVGVYAFALVLVSGQARAFEFFDGRLQVHGFYEMALRSIWEDFSPENQWDMSQWYHVLNIEAEAEIAPDGFGPVDMLSGFIRVEVRYDCVWRRACWMFPSVNSYGDEAKRMPNYITDGRRSGYSGSQFLGDTRRYNGVRQLEDLAFEQRDKRLEDPKKPVDFPFIAGFEGFFDIAGLDGQLGTADDPALNSFSRYIGSKCVFGHQRLRGPEAGGANRVIGPWDPRCEVEPNGALKNQPNPFKATDKNGPVLGGAGGTAALPYRPAPKFNFNDPPRNHEAQGIFYPTHQLARELRKQNFDSHDQNFTQDQLSWNHGASQTFWRELKELYADLEFFDSRLWVRVGKQNIVWGKTELFRTTDQFNPQDLGISSLPSLEESRIAVWAARGVWSFYEVGPFEDFRFEVAFNFDTFEPTDIGQCGEAYSPLPVCSKRFGLLAHGATGVGIAGEKRPAEPWQDIRGIEIGARLEFRWNRFAVAISDWYGYDDSFWVDRIHNYSRNVDPLTGRPRERSELRNQDRCRSGFEDACLRPDEALEKHSLNQQIFAMICASSISFSSLDTTSCAQSVFNSRVVTQGFAISEALSVIMSGQGQTVGGAQIGGLLGGAFDPATSAPYLRALAGPDMFQGTADDPFPFMQAAFGPGVLGIPSCIPALPAIGNLNCIPTPLVPLGIDPNDGPASARHSSGFAGVGLNPFLTDEQEALLGCGPFYGTDCDFEGIDLLNAEASALMQSWPSFGGTFGVDWSTLDRSRSQPGTVGYEGGAVCTRSERGRNFILPGCRGPGDSGYTINKDGSLTGAVAGTGGPQPGYLAGDPDGAGPAGQQTLVFRRHPFTGQKFASEMAVLSWNYLLTLVLNNGPAAGESPTETQFDARNPLRKGACSLAQPQYCGNISSALAVTGVGRANVLAGGNGRFGRRDWLWAGGGEAILRYEKRNVLGMSVDFAEDATKSNWSLEFTWIEDIPSATVDDADGNEDIDLWNLTVSVDRPTFINFLNANRTFFINSQWFFQYIEGHTKGHTRNGPWNMLFTFAVNTGYLQDRLLPSLVTVYDFGSNSGAVLPQVQYRFSSNFSATVGMAFFAGRMERRSLDFRPLSLPNAVGSDRNSSFVENGLTAIRQRDEIFMKIRYTF